MARIPAIASAGLSAAGPSGTDSGPMPTLAEYVEVWSVAYNRPPWVSQRTADLRSRILRADVLPEFGAHRLDAITVPEVGRWQQRLLARGVSIGYARFVVTAFSAPLLAAYREGLIDRVATHQLRWPRRQFKRPDPYTPAETRRVIRWFHAHKPHYVPLVSLVALVGLRPSEACGLTWGDIDLEQGLVSIERARVNRVVGEPKTDRSRRRIRLPGEVLDVLRAMDQRGELVVTAEDGRPVASAGFSYHWRIACEGAGVRYRGFYRARSGFLTKAVNRGANLIHVSEYSGTSVHMLARHYVRWIGAHEVPGEPRRKRPNHRDAAISISPTLSKGRKPKR